MDKPAIVLRFHIVSQMVELSGVLLPSIDLSAAKYKYPNLWCHRITSSSLLLGVIESKRSVIKHVTTQKAKAEAFEN